MQLGERQFFGQGQPANTQTALRTWLRALACESPPPPRALFYIGFLAYNRFVSGCGTADEGREMLWRAGDAGDVYARIACVLQGVERYDQSKTVERLQLADPSHPMTAYFLAYCYYAPLGVSEDRERSVSLWQQAATVHHNPFAMFSLATAFRHGTGTAVDPVQALRWFEAAAQRDGMSAQFETGRCYELGLGLAVPDVERARFWYQRAAAQGHARATEALARLDASI